MKTFLKLNKELFTYSRIIIRMGISDFKNEYAGSALGIVWGIVKPFMLIAVYNIVFSTQKMDGIPFLIWLIPGLFLWTFLSDALIGGSAAIRSNSHLVKKVVFPISILPATRILSIALNHFIFMFFGLAILVISKQPIHLQLIQIIYYFLASVIFTLAITRLLSAMAVMSVDILHFLQTILQMLFWISPVLWSPTNPTGFVANIMIILKFNPYFYLIEGYRQSFFTDTWFWESPGLTLYFWGITAMFFILGSLYYEKNREEFSDVL